MKPSWYVYIKIPLVVLIPHSSAQLMYSSIRFMSYSVHVYAWPFSFAFRQKMIQTARPSHIWQVLSVTPPNDSWLSCGILCGSHSYIHGTLWTARIHQSSLGASPEARSLPGSWSTLVDGPVSPELPHVATPRAHIGIYEPMHLSVNVYRAQGTLLVRGLGASYSAS